MNIIGINAFHGDSSACLVADGEMVTAVEEERFRRIKHWAGFPSESIRYCLEVADLTLTDIDHIAINQDPKKNLLKKIGYSLATRPELALIIDRFNNKRKRRNINENIKAEFPGQPFNGRIHNVEHHLSHMSSCFHVSPYTEAAIVSVDGFGDFASAAWGSGKGTKISVMDKVFFPHSLGIFYQALTQYIGFPNYGDEYKVMGLAPYGKPLYLEEMRKIVLLQPNGGFKLNLKYFKHHSSKIEYEWENGSPKVGELFSENLKSLLGPVRSRDDEIEQHHIDIAHSVQCMYEEAFFHLLNNLHSTCNLPSVTVAGGCGMNSVANGKIIDNTQFENVYVQSAAGDAGGAIGAAMVTWHNVGGAKRNIRCTPHNHAYWGPSFTDDEISLAITTNKSEFDSDSCQISQFKNSNQLCTYVADKISQGLVIGWFQGKMEWGPRALGNRSIICDPRRNDIKDILNLKIKRRESFRPFAPSILRQYVKDWFYTDVDVPFMMQVHEIRKEKRAEIPAVTHVDGSGRLQTVDHDTNPIYAMLIQAFMDQTGVPIVLNTSFNENEPVVCNPGEAIACFLRTKMDVLVMGTWLVERN